MARLLFCLWQQYHSKLFDSNGVSDPVHGLGYASGNDIEIAVLIYYEKEGHLMIHQNFLIASMRRR